MDKITNIVSFGCSYVRHSHDNQNIERQRQEQINKIDNHRQNAKLGISKLVQEQSIYVSTSEEYKNLAKKIKNVKDKNAKTLEKMKNKLDSKRSRLYNMYQDFRIQFMANNGRFVPEYWKGTKSQLQTENIDNQTVEIETTNPAVRDEFTGYRIIERVEKNILNALNSKTEDVIFDIKIDKTIKPVTPEFLQHSDKNRVYIKVAETKPEGHEGFAYYQYLSTYKPGTEFYNGDASLGEQLYKKEDHFFPGVISKPTSKVLLDSLVFETNVLSKFANKIGDKLILRNYNDVSRRDAKMYDIEGVQDHWQTEQKEIHKLKEEFKKIPIENTKAKRNNLQSQEKLNKRKLEKSPVRYTIDLGNGVSLRIVEEIENTQAKINMTRNSIEGPC